jgi:hypothetical protein
MKRNLREKALRIIVSSLLSSELTPDDILSISNSISRGDDFSRDLVSLLNNVVNTISDSSINLLKSNYDITDSNIILNNAMKIVKNKRISKTRIINYLNLIDPNSNLYRENKTAYQLLFDFFKRRPEDGNRLKNLLETGEIGGDDYLKGIMKRDQ